MRSTMMSGTISGIARCCCLVVWLSVTLLQSCGNQNINTPQVVVGGGGTGTGTTMSMQPAAQPEVRGVWLTLAGSTVLNSRDNIAAAMRLLRDNGFNVVFPVVWARGYTLWRSARMQQEFGLPIGEQFGNRDVLAEIVQEARTAGLAVIPWFEYGFASFNDGLGAPPGLILQRKPEWRAIGVDGRQVVKNGFYWMNALDTNVQNFITDLVMEVVNGYDIDGIQGDDRMPALPSEAGYDSTTRARYRAETGMDAPTNTKDQRWLQWRADKLTDWLARLRQTVKARKSSLVFAMSPSPYPFGFTEYLQDNPAWMQRGLVDLLSVQLYRRDFPSYEGLAMQMLTQTPAGTTRRLAPGILARVDPYIIAPELLAQKIEYNRRIGIGSVLFFYEALTANNNALAQSLRAGAYRTNVPFPRDTLLRRP